MVLRFYGGVAPDMKSRLTDSTTEYVLPPAVAVAAEGEAAVPKNKAVLRGELISKGSIPVYSPICGVFRGVFERNGVKYALITANGGKEELLLSPETRALAELSSDAIAAWAMALGIVDSRSEAPLFKLLESAAGKVKRVIVDCTESDPLSGINSRLCIEHGADIVRGAKIILHAVGAIKAVFTLEKSKKIAFDALAREITDKSLCVPLLLDEKYPYLDTTLVDAVMISNLAKGHSPVEKGALIVSAESAMALARGMGEGKLCLDRYISVCGSCSEKNLVLPKGTLTSHIADFCRFGSDFVKNSRLCGELAGETVDDTVRALIAVKPKKVEVSDCFFCGECASACPMRLVPYRAFTEKLYADAKYCVSCGACSHACPSGIPLTRLMKEAKR